MRKLFLCIPALAILAVACQKVNLTPAQEDGNEPTPAVEKMIIETVSGTRGVETKATISNDTKPAFAWSIDDNVAVHVSKGETHKYVVTSSGADKAEASAKFEVTYDEGYARDAFAVYPSTIVATDAANYGQSGHTLDLKLPSSYTLAEVSGETSPGPMISTNNAGENWKFHQLCGLLRLTVNSIPPSTTRLEIDFDGKQVWGEFSISDPTPGTSAIATKADDDHDIITITKDGSSDVTLNNNAWLDGQVLNIPLPVGTYTNITITAYNSLGDAILLPVTRPFAYTADREHGTKRTASFPVFSVSSSKRVLFAPGNLQATTTNGGSNWTWKFADNQYDMIGSAEANTKINGNGTISTTNGTVDLFGRSTEKTYYGISNSSNQDNYNGDFKDWGTISTFIYKGSSTTYPSTYWFTLSQAEWKYLLGEGGSPATYYRKNGGIVSGVANALCTKAKVNGIRGFIIFPDYYDDVTISGVTWAPSSISPGNMENSGTTGWGATITLDGWTYLEKQGCVFLPAAGRRNGSSVFSCSNSDNDQAVYLSSVVGMTLRVSSAGFDPDQNNTQYYGYSVRLVHEVK